MADLSKVLVIIPARGGSKGLPRKNVLDLAGHPLLAWSIKVCDGRGFGRVVVSSDSDEILAIAERYGAQPWRRAEVLAQDESPAADAVLEVLNKTPGYDWFVLLQPTSPLRTFEDIVACLHLAYESEVRSAVSLVEIKSPAWSMKLAKDGSLLPTLGWSELGKRRQEFEGTYLPNGAVYVSAISDFIKNPTFFKPGTRGYVMPQERSVDIDSAFDLRVAATLLTR